MLNEIKERISHKYFSNILLSVIVSHGKKVPSDKIASPSANVRWPTVISRPGEFKVTSPF